MRLERRITQPESRSAHAERRDAAEQECARRWPSRTVILSRANGTYYATPLIDGAGATRELEA